MNHGNMCVSCDHVRNSCQRVVWIFEIMKMSFLIFFVSFKCFFEITCQLLNYQQKGDNKLFILRHFLVLFLFFFIFSQNPYKNSSLKCSKITCEHEFYGNSRFLNANWPCPDHS